MTMLPKNKVSFVMSAAFDICVSIFSVCYGSYEHMFKFHNVAVNQTSNVSISVPLRQFYRQRSFIGSFLLRGVVVLMCIVISVAAIKAFWVEIGRVVVACRLHVFSFVC